LIAKQNEQTGLSYTGNIFQPIFQLKNISNYLYEPIQIRSWVHAPSTQGAVLNEAPSKAKAATSRSRDQASKLVGMSR
jgi:hypothetical protein